MRLIYIEENKNSQNNGEIAETRCNFQYYPVIAFVTYCLDYKYSNEFGGIKNINVSKICDTSFIYFLYKNII